MDRLDGYVCTTENGNEVYRTNYGIVKGYLDGFVKANPRINPLNITKYCNEDNVVWYKLSSKETHDAVAILGVYEGYHFLDDFRTIHAAMLMAKPGHNYGMELLKAIFNFYKGMREELNVSDFSLIVDPDAKISLFTHYYENLPGWKVEPFHTEWWDSVRISHSFKD